MLVVVRLISGRNGTKYYSPVDQGSSDTLFRAYGYGWFFQRNWQIAKRLLEKEGHKLSNRWYHIQRRSDGDPYLVHQPSGQSVYYI